MSDISKGRIASEAEPAPLPNGPAAAAILAGGIGTAWYGLMVVASEWVPTVAQIFTLNKGVGPLSGKTTFGMLGFLAAWAILANMWKGANLDVDKVWKVSLVLIGLGLIFTFPTFFRMLAPH